MNDVVQVACGRCQRMHAAEVTARDGDGWAVATELIEPCPSEALAQLVASASEVFVIGVDSGHFEIAEQGLDAVLWLLDEEEP